MAKYLKGGDWLALGVGLIGFALLMPVTAIVEDYGLSHLAAIARNGALPDVAWQKYIGLALIGLVLDIFYAPVTAIALRSVNFRGFLKYPFCLLVFPVFARLMIDNIVWSSEHLAWLVGDVAGRSGKGSAVIGFILSAPLPTAVCTLWYFLFAGLDRLLPRPAQLRESSDGSGDFYLERHDEVAKTGKAAKMAIGFALAGLAAGAIWAITRQGSEIHRAPKSAEWSAIEPSVVAPTVSPAATLGAAAPAPLGTLDLDKIIALLRAGNFADLETRLTPYQAAYEAASSGEWELLHVIAAFERIEPDLEAAFNAWVAAQPQSYLARTARGAYFYRRAWAFRGARYFDDTPSVRLAAARELFERAAEDFLASRKLSSRPQVSDRYLIAIAMEEGERAAARRIYMEAVRGDPENYGARRAYLNTLRPEWGGTVKAMQSFVEETAAAAQTPKQRTVVKYLEASQLGYLGFHYERRREFGPALQLYDAALTKTEDSIVLVRRARVLMQLNRPGEALRNVERAIELEPASADAFEYRGILREQRNQIPAALEDYRHAAVYGSTYSIQRLGIMHLTGKDVRKDYHEAAKWLQLGAEFGEARAENYLGWMYSEGAGVPRDPMRALELWYASADQGNEEARHYLDGIPWYWRARYKIATLWRK